MPLWAGGVLLACFALDARPSAGGPITPTTGAP